MNSIVIFGTFLMISTMLVNLIFPFVSLHFNRNIHRGKVKQQQQQSQQCFSLTDIEKKKKNIYFYYKFYVHNRSMKDKVFLQRTDGLKSFESAVLRA